MHSTAGCSLSILLVRHRMGLFKETGSSFVHSKAQYVSQLMECVWGWTDNECEGERRECRKSAACGTPTCSIEIMTYSHIPGSWWLSAPPDIWSCRETVWHRPSCQSTVFNFSFLALSSPRPLPLKLHLAQNYLIKGLFLFFPHFCPAWWNTFLSFNCLCITPALTRPVVFTLAIVISPSLPCAGPLLI